MPTTDATPAADAPTDPARTRWTQEDLHVEARRRFGDDPRDISFVCPGCRDVADPGDFLIAGADPNRIGQECIGRSLGALDRDNRSGRSLVRGCDWAAYGLFRGPWLITAPGYHDDGTPTDDTREVPGFALADHARRDDRTDAERAAVAAAWAKRGPVTDRVTGESIDPAQSGGQD